MIWTWLVSLRIHQLPLKLYSYPTSRRASWHNFSTYLLGLVLVLRRIVLLSFLGVVRYLALALAELLRLASRLGRVLLCRHGGCKERMLWLVGKLPLTCCKRVVVRSGGSYLSPKVFVGVFAYWALAYEWRIT